MELDRYIKTYERDLRKIEEAFEFYEHSKGHFELDTEMIEEILLDWEEFMEELRQENDEDFDELADEIFEKIEEFQTLLDDYNHQHTSYEEMQAVDNASERLSKPGFENYLQHQADSSQKDSEIGRYERAISRFNVSDEKGEIGKNRLELDE